MDFEAAGLLEGLDGRDRAARERLLERLASDGSSEDELRRAVAEDRLALLPVERILGGRHSARDLERETGLPADLLLRLRRLTGLPDAGPDEPVFADEDIAAAHSTKLFLDAGFDEEAIAALTRVLGESMARIAATATAAFGQTFLHPGDTEDDVATRFATLAERLTPSLTPVLVAALRAHLHDAVRRAVLGRENRASGRVAGVQELGVCFADLVGFTRLGGRIDVEELGTVAGRLGALAAEAADAPVRLVKTIGDAAMLVSGEIAPLVDAALTLVERAEAEELPALRAGIASGPAHQRAGDFYGHAVNLASRVTGIARPGSVLCTQEVRDQAPDAFAWSFAGRHRLKGIHEPVALHRARRITADEEPRTPTADRRRRRASR